MENPKSLYKKLSDNGLYSKTYEDFVGQYGNAKGQKELYTKLSSNGLYSKSEQEFVVEDILDSRIHYHNLQYRIKWLGYTSENDSWEPHSNVTNAAELIATFHRCYPLAPSLTNKKDRRIRCTPPKRGGTVRN